MSHTPGPWGSTNHRGEVWNGEWLVARAYDMGKDKIGKDEQESNARLIAAAPEMLDALKRCIAALVANDAPNCEAAKEAISAIAKAEGR